MSSILQVIRGSLERYGTLSIVVHISLIFVHAGSCIQIDLSTTSHKYLILLMVSECRSYTIHQNGLQTNSEQLTFNDTLALLWYMDGCKWSKNSAMQRSPVNTLFRLTSGSNMSHECTQCYYQTTTTEYHTLLVDCLFWMSFV